MTHKYAKALIANCREFAQSTQPWQSGHGETKRTASGGSTLYEIYLAKPETLISPATVKVEDVLKDADMDEFIAQYAKEKIKKLQRGSVKGFIAENPTIKLLNAFDDTRIGEIEKILQIRRLYTHQNGIVDDKFRRCFPATNANDEYPMTLDESAESVDNIVDEGSECGYRWRCGFSVSYGAFGRNIPPEATVRPQPIEDHLRMHPVPAASTFVTSVA